MTLGEVYGAFQGRLDALSRRSGRWSAFVTVLKIGAYVGPAVGAYFVATYFRFNPTLYLDSESVVQPLAAYVEARSGYALDAGYERRFFAEFSKFYFGRDNDFREAFWSPGLDPDPLNWRMVFRNPRSAEAQLISTVEARVTAHHQPFDWSRVDATANVRVDIDDGKVNVRDTGVGPAVNVKSQISVGDLHLREANRQLLHNGTWQRVVWGTELSELVALPLKGDSGELDDPVYWQVVSKQDAQGPVTACRDNILFERVRSRDRLAQLTTVVRGGTERVDVTFESLRGEKGAQSASLALPTDRAFITPSERLNVRSDPCAELAVAAGAAARSPAGVMGAAPALVDRLAGPAAELKGVDLVKTAIRVPLGQVSDRGVVARLASPDEILNAGGFLVLDLALQDPKNGSYDLAVRVNGLEVRRLSFPVLMPDEMSFQPNDLDRELQKFRPARQPAK